MESLIKKHGKYDGCVNIDDIVKRYRSLDTIFEQIRKEGRFRIRKEFNQKNFREKGGVLVHIGPYGEPFFGMGGCHRFAIALILKLKLPSQIGCVYKDAIPLLKNLRKQEIV